MHDRQHEFHLAEVDILEGSPLSDRTLEESAIRERTGSLVLALRTASGDFITNPAQATTISPGQTLIVIGTAAEFDQLMAISRPDASGTFGPDDRERGAGR